jgi:hypothetical protein
MKYVGTTLKDVFDEVVMRLNQNRKAEALDWTTTVKMINQSIGEVVDAILPYKRESFVEPLAVQDGNTIPSRFIRRQRLLCKIADKDYIEARPVDIEEFFSLINNEYDAAYLMQPIYTFWSKVVVNRIHNFYIKIYPNYESVLEFFAVPAVISLPTDIVPIPYEFMDILIALTLERIYLRIGEPALIKNLHEEVLKMRKSVLETYLNSKAILKREFEVYVEPQVQQ